MASPVDTRVLEVLEWPSVIAELSRRCSTDPGRQRAETLSPLSRDDIRKRLRKTSELKEVLIQGEAPDFSGVSDIRSSIERAVKEGTLRLEELYAVREFILASRKIRAFFNSRREYLPSWRDQAGSISPCSEPGQELIPAFTDNGDLSSSHFPRLKQIRDEINALKTEIEKRINDLIHAPSMDKVLQEKIYSTRNERYVLLIKSSMKHQVKGNSLDVSSSGATVFMEPEQIQPLNNRLNALLVELQIEISRIVRELSLLVGKHGAELELNLDIMADADLHNSAARFSIDLKGCEPEVPGEPVIKLLGARHPLLYLMSPETTVPNDITLGYDYTGLIISGANTGGKTVLLKTTGLCVLMIMHGLHIPAGPDSVLGPFSSIMADIGDDQSIIHSLSSFSGQIVVLREMLDKADSRTLVLIDEIIVGTNPRQGAALAQSFVEQLVATGARIVVSTHYSELKELAGKNPSVRNASVSFDLETLSPTYRLTTGLPGVSYALEIARLYGMPETIITRAKELLDSRELSVESLIETMQRYEQDIREERARLDLIREDMEREKTHLHEREKTLERQRENLKNERGVEFLDELHRLRARVNERIGELRQAGMKEAGNVRQELEEIQSRIIADLEKNRKIRYSRKYRPFDPGRAAPGDRVFVLPLEKEAVIADMDMKGETAELLLGSSIKSRFPFRDLLTRPVGDGAGRSTGSARTGKHEKSAPAEGAPHSPPEKEGITIQTSYNTVDLRGMRVEEALIKMEADFDRMLRGGITPAVVIHGHGTGAMKEAVRAGLSQSSYVDHFRPGKYGEGGDGVSIVYLRV